MNLPKRFCFCSATVAAAIVAFAATTVDLQHRAEAADYPAGPITLIVPYPAGGGNDVIARLVAAKMSASLGQPIVIENRGGAGSTIGARDAARSAPDGYTLLFDTSSLAINHDWVDTNTPPPSAPPIALHTPTPPALTPVTYILDSKGNETGGLRTPFVDYPDRQWVVNDTTVTSTGPLGALFCTLYGYTVPFTTAVLKSLYKNHGDYVSGVVHETNDLLKNRFLQSWNADTIKQNAGESSIR